jgi:hypothetical protein
MRHTMFPVLLLVIILLLSCKSVPVEPIVPTDEAYTIVKNISYQGVSVDVVIDKPENNALDVLIVFHGTVQFDSLILQAAENSLSIFKSLLDRNDMMLVSVAYPEEDMLFGDNIQHAQAALLWVQNEANEALKIKVNKVFLAGHSQGGYLVSRLNSMHPTAGVIANAPGPLNLLFRCHLEEIGQVPPSIACTLLQDTYGNTSENPNAYIQRSLLHFTNGFKSDILYVQGLNDSPIQMHSWPIFKQKVEDCTNCRNSEFLELEGLGHNAMFQSSLAKAAFNEFINRE